MRGETEGKESDGHELPIRSIVEQMHALVPDSLPPEQETEIISAMDESLQERKQRIIESRQVRAAIEELIFSVSDQTAGQSS
jgi:hypothetical protein